MVSVKLRAQAELELRRRQNKAAGLPPPQAGPQTAFLQSTADIVSYGGSAGSGKLQRAAKTGQAIRQGKLFMEDALVGKTLLSYDSSFGEAQLKDSKVLSWAGKWVDFSDVKVGDRIMNPDGQHQEVLQVHEHGMQQFYRLTFEDGTSVECGADHLWSFWEARTNSRSKSSNGINPVETNLTPRGWNTNYITRARVRDTRWLMSEMAKGRRFIFPINAPLQFTSLNRSDSDKAYFYGCLIGDGSYSHDSINVVTSDRFIADKLLNILGDNATLRVDPPAKEGYLEQIIVGATKVKWVKAWLSNNQYKGKRSWEKTFPDGYLSASLEFRYAFAQGLFDTDGTVGRGKREVSYCTTSKELAVKVASLVRSLGYMARISEKQPKYTHKGEYLDGRLAYNVYVQGNHLELLFSLPRKVERAKDLGQFNGGMSWPGKMITSIEPTDIDYARCITVSNPNHLYVTDDYTVTHNSLGMLLDFAKPEYLENPEYKGVIFRRTYPELKNSGGLWDESFKLYPSIGGESNQQLLQWKFPSGATIRFSQLQHEKTVYSWQGAQIGRLGFDEITHFSETQFFYMLSRVRSTSGIPTAIRATCNPDAESWLAEFIDWWINPAGIPYPERSGVIRWFIRQNSETIWADTEQELLDLHPGSFPKSFTFISAKITDNQILLLKDPGYLANLQAQHPVERARLLDGNWRVKLDAGKVFDRSWFSIIHAAPLGITSRFWDLAATAKEVASGSHYYTAGTKITRIGEIYTVMDCLYQQVGPSAVEDLILKTAEQDGRQCLVRWELEGGSAGILFSDRLRSRLRQAGYNADYIKPVGDKVTRAMPMATEASNGKVRLLLAPWNDQYLSAVHAFDGSPKPLVNDIVDSSSGAFQAVQGHRQTLIQPRQSVNSPGAVRKIFK